MSIGQMNYSNHLLASSITRALSHRYSVSVKLFTGAATNLLSSRNVGYV
ncbi:hypothetical protein BH23PAT2_BH23PAT2_08120 [soil metagenome]